ncbi:MAG: reverse transcriptase domain-containing protein, partial [Pirellulaceae bacterium]
MGQNEPGCPTRLPFITNLIQLLHQRAGNETQTKWCRRQVGERLVNSLLYADDVVLMTETPEDLQTLIDVVDDFCRKWRMDINLKKSEVMVANEKPGTAPAGRSWHCRDTTLKVVPEYKYLGIHFKWNLDWNTHVDYMINKAKRRTSDMMKLLVNSRISVKAKLLVWFAFVRPILDYGCEVWDANTKHLGKMEAVQHKAGVLAFKLNEHTNKHAVRVLMGCTSLESRYQGFRLRYFRELLSMDEDRLTRYVVTLSDKGKRVNRGPEHRSWLPSVMEHINEDTRLKVGYRRLLDAANRNCGRVPTIEQIGEDVKLFHREDGREESKIGSMKGRFPQSSGLQRSLE